MIEFIRFLAEDKNHFAGFVLVLVVVLWGLERIAGKFSGYE